MEKFFASTEIFYSSVFIYNEVSLVLRKSPEQAQNGLEVKASQKTTESEFISI